MINPVKFHRLAQHLTQDQLARRSGVTRQVVTLAEQGLYNSLPSSLVETLTTDQDQLHLRAEYLTWVNQKRYENQYLFYKVDLSLAKQNHEWSTLKNQVAGRSQQAFCRALVYQASLIREFEKFGRGWNNICSALVEVGVSPSDINKLEPKVQMK